MNEKLVSIVMVNYNQERFIKEAIDSVIAQTYQNWELIIVDDGSTDQSVDIIKNYDDLQYLYLCNMGILKINTEILQATILRPKKRHRQHSPMKDELCPLPIKSKVFACNG